MTGVRRRGTDRREPHPDETPASSRDQGNDADLETIRTEPEPEWADAIRRGRRTRTERLRSVFATFDEDDAGTAPRATGEEGSEP